MNQNYEPITAWGYFWLQILYAIPVIGFIFLIVNAIGHPNINRRNFARSYFCILVIALIILVIALVTGAGAFIIDSLTNK